MKPGWLRRQLPAIAALILVTGLYFAATPWTASADTKDGLAGDFAFTPLSVAEPGGFPEQTIRKVNKDYEHIDAWISSVGAGVAMNDLDSDGLSNDLCISDPRIDQVVVTPTPGARENRYEPFALSTQGLPMGPAIAPMGCVPGDFNEDGRMDLLVYYWGRTPIVFLARGAAQAAAPVSTLDADAYKATELVPGAAGGTYRGPLWNSNTAAVDDFDGDGHVDIYIGNYFPDGPVLDDTRSDGVVMNRSLSRATNGGKDFFFCWMGGSAGAEPTVTYKKLDDVLLEEVSRGWGLGAAANDLDGDGLPELYLAQDHGTDALLYNRSTPGNFKFSRVRESRGPMTPKSKRVGRDSFKGMGVDFGDLDGDGLYDMYVSNITTPFGLQESQFTFMNEAKDQTELRRQFERGQAPFADRSQEMGLAWSGWGWDVKMADFNNSGNLQVAQTTGFIKGAVDRWPQLQELAMANDLVVEHQGWWPDLRAGDDIAGNQKLHFFVRESNDRYTDIAGQLGLAIPIPTRGIAVGDADGDGRLDLAVARQWDEPIFYHNDSPSPGAFLGLRMSHADIPGFSPVVGAQVRVTTPDGRVHVTRVDGGSGHSGKRSHEVHVGLGENVTEPVQVHLTWRDRAGQEHEQNLQLTPGWHDLRLGTDAKEG